MLLFISHKMRNPEMFLKQRSAAKVVPLEN